jgi:hypothetical protein
MAAPTLLQSAVAVGSALAMNAARRAAVAIMGYVVAGALLAASFIFLTVSAYRAIGNAIGDIYAGLLVGSAYFVAALVVLVILGFRNR